MAATNRAAHEYPMMDFLTRLAARTLGVGARVAPDLVSELAGGPRSMLPEGAEPGHGDFGVLPADAAAQPPERTPDQTASDDTAPRFTTTGHHEEGDAGKLPAAAPSDAVALVRPARRPVREDAVLASHEQANRVGSGTASIRFIPLVRQERGGNSTLSPNRDARGQTGAAQVASPAWSAQRAAEEAQQAGPGESGNQGDRRNAGRRTILPFAQPASDPAIRERAGNATAPARESPMVRVTIGRIEVRATAPAVRQTPRNAPPVHQGVSLEAYLKARNESRR